MKKTIPFVNREGKTYHFPRNATLKDLVKARVTSVRLAKPEEPLKKDWFAEMREHVTSRIE